MLLKMSSSSQLISQASISSSKDDNSISSQYSASNLMKNWLNNIKHSDVTFLIVENNQQVHAMTHILASVSAVFDSMFFGDIKMKKSQPIQIIDLTYDGFFNMLKYVLRIFFILTIQSYFRE